METKIKADRYRGIMSDEKVRILIEFDGRSSEFVHTIDTNATANQVWIAGMYLTWLAEQAHQENRLAQLMAQQQREMQNKIVTPDVARQQLKKDMKL